MAPEVRRLARRLNGATARRAAVAWALGVAAVRFFRSGELIVRVFALAVVVNLGAYMISTHAQNLLGAREMAAVLPLGAVLAGRVLGDRIPAWIRVATGWLVPVLAVLTAGYLAALGYGAAQISAELTSELIRPSFRALGRHMYRIRRLATTTSASTASAPIGPR
ncbi:MAG TPA: hypothetical protein VHO07_04625 [Streptosporangiaceae bacterium]|nr:hypothetical protein [Streptosporangiaceae bacterium]